MRTKPLKILLALSVIALLETSCNVAYRVLLGIDTSPEWQTDEELAKSARKHKIPEAYSLVLDTSTYLSALKALYTEASQKLKQYNSDSTALANLKKSLKDDLQPAQFRLFDANGTEVFKLVNCYIDPPIPLSWNVEGCFDSFPPKTTIQSLNTHLFDLNFVLAHAKFSNQGKPAFRDLPKADFYGVVIWNDFYKRPSKRLIKTVRKQLKTGDKSIVFIYINNQNQQIWPRLNATQKTEVAAFYTE